MSSSSFLSRALPASIFLIIGILGFYYMDMISMITNYPPPTASGFIEWSGGRFPIFEKFHWVPPLDPIIREITPGFAPSSFGYDDVSRWQMFNFIISDVGVFYLIWGCESLRGSVNGGPVYYPAVFALIAQLAGGGFVIPIYYFAYLTYTSPLCTQPVAKRTINIRGSIIWAISMVLLHTIPAIGMMLDTTFEARHWWTWFWQLYVVRISLAWYAVNFISRRIPIPAFRSNMSYQTMVTLLYTPFIGIAVAFWTYTLLYCPHKLSEVFIPRVPTEDTWVLHMRRMLQFDQIFVNGSSVLWVALDSRRNGLGSAIRISAAGLLLTALVGPGASLGILWLWRERQLISHYRTMTGKAL